MTGRVQERVQYGRIARWVGKLGHYQDFSDGDPNNKAFRFTLFSWIVISILTLVQLVYTACL